MQVDSEDRDENGEVNGEEGEESFDNDVIIADDDQSLSGDLPGNTDGDGLGLNDGDEGNFGDAGNSPPNTHMSGEEFFGDSII